MAGAARIGALHVMLGLDSADFTAGLARAQSGLGKFSKVAAVGLAAVATAAVAATAALGMAIKGSIDNADKMGEVAQQVGVSVEALTSLGYAAKLSGSSVETLSTGLRKLSQNMLAVAQGSTGPVATAFQMLGVSVTNANGSLRASDQVLIDVAEKFKGMQDGAAKTALAVQLFGRSGAELIPLLNQGRDGIAGLTAEAEKYGITISGATADAAGRFNDAMDRLSMIFTGMVNKIMAAVVPGLEALATSLTTTAGDFGGLQLAVDAAVWIFNEFMIFIAQTKGMLDTLAVSLYSVGRAMEFMKQGDPGGAFATLAQTGAEVDMVWKGVADTVAKINSGELGGANPSSAGSGLSPLIPDAAQIGAASEALKKLQAEGKAVFDATRTPAEALSLELENLNRLLNSGAIDWDTYGRAVKMAQDKFDGASVAATELKSTFKDVFKGFITDIKDGNGLLESLGSALGKIGDKLLDMALSGLFDVFAGGGKGGGIFGMIGSLFGLPAFANGTSNAPGGLALVGERGPELVNLPSGSQVIPNSALGGGQMNVAISLDNALLRAIVTDEAGRVVGQAAPTIVGAATQQAGKNAPGALAKYQSEQAGSDYRL